MIILPSPSRRPHHHISSCCNSSVRPSPIYARPLLTNFINGLFWDMAFPSSHSIRIVYHLLHSSIGLLRAVFCGPGIMISYNSTVAILGSKQHVGLTHTILTPEALCGPTFMNVAITLVSPFSPSGPMFASLTLRVISASISD